MRADLATSSVFHNAFEGAEDESSTLAEELGGLHRMGLCCWPCGISPALQHPATLALSLAFPRHRLLFMFCFSVGHNNTNVCGWMCMTVGILGKRSGEEIPCR